MNVYIGGHLLNLIRMCSILLRFRCYLVAILADVEKAFLQIGEQAKERDDSCGLFVCLQICHVVLAQYAVPFF